LVLNHCLHPKSGFSCSLFLFEKRLLGCLYRFTKLLLFIPFTFQYYIKFKTLFFSLAIELDNIDATEIQDISYINKAARLLEVRAQDLIDSLTTRTIFTKVNDSSYKHIHLGDLYSNYPALLGSSR
jgi:hypothetical protein